jgi:cytidylate kinase
MGTVVFPSAPLKIFLDASAEVRARRREKELLEAGKTVIFEKIFRDISERDRRDRERVLAPLKAADDAYLLDSSCKDAAQVLEMALNWANEKGLLS